jgi:poly-gamma-glutamate synthesis protein (capsule biosynthesis protein)
MVEDIKRAKEQADIVIMTDHWGLHHTRAVIPDYEFEVGHAAIDAGADLVLGTHPHILKGIEVYRGKVIAHSLANFALEGWIAREEGELRMMRLKSWHEMEKQRYGAHGPDEFKSLILKCIISEGKIERVSYIPVMLDATRANPEPLPHTDPRAQEIFQYVEDISREVDLDTKYFWEGDEVVIGT